MTHTARMSLHWTCLVLALAAPLAPAQNVSVRNVADSTQPFRVLARPAINDAGTVAFVATGGVPGDAGVYRVDSNGTLTTVEVPAVGTPSRLAIGDSGTVTVLGQSLLQVAPDGTATPIADSSGPFAGISGFAAPRSGSGPVLFQAALDNAVGAGIFNGPDPAANRLDNATSQTAQALAGLGRGDAPRFIARRPGGGGFAVYGGPDPVGDVVTDLSNFSSVEQYTENARGDVLMVASRPNGVSGLYNGPDPIANRVADTTGALWPARAFLNDNGQVVILGQAGANGTGALYSGTDPATDRLLGIGDPLFGSTLQSFGFNLADQEAFNNRGELAFGYTLANGVTGVAVLTVPEPAALGLFPLAVLLFRRRRVAHDVSTSRMRRS